MMAEAVRLVEQDPVEHEVRIRDSEKEPPVKVGLLHLSCPANAVCYSPTLAQLEFHFIHYFMNVKQIIFLLISCILVTQC